MQKLLKQLPKQPKKKLRSLNKAPQPILERRITMEFTFETEKGLVTISEHSITIDNKVYNICSEQLSCGEYETYDLQETDRFIVSDPTTNKTYNFVLYYDHDLELQYAEEVLHEDVYYYTYRLTPRED